MAIGQHEGLHHVVDHPDSYLQQFVLARSLVVGNSSFQKVSCAVHFVSVHVCPAFIQSCQCIVSVDVTVFQLGCGKLVNPLVHMLLQFWVGMVDKAVGHALYSFIHI